MEPGLGVCMKSTYLLVIVLSGYALVGVNSRKLVNFKPLKFLHTLKGVAGNLRLLRECRRQLTFVASTALGTYITRVIKESPLTPLPLPPLEDAPRWNFLTLPLHVTAPYRGWMKEHFERPQQFYKELDNLASTWSLREPDSNSVDTLGWRGRPRFRRDLLRMPQPSPHVIATAVVKTLKFLNSAVSHNKGMKHFLKRWCS